MFRILKDLFTSDSGHPRVAEFKDIPGKGYRGPTPAKAVAKAPAVIDPTVQVVAPADGRVLALNQVPDPTIANRHLGEGLAIAAEGSPDGAYLVHTPVRGTVRFPFATPHAFIVHTDTGVDVLVHIGLGTTGTGVALPDPTTFRCLIQDNTAVQAGQPVVRLATALGGDPGARTPQGQATDHHAPATPLGDNHATLPVCVLVQNLHEHNLVLRPNAPGLRVFAGDDLFSLEVR